MQKLILVLALVMMIVMPAMTFDLPSVQLTSDTVVGNILFEPKAIVSMALLILTALFMVWDGSIMLENKRMIVYINLYQYLMNESYL